jgi:signal transduction histidine kinase
MSRALPTSWLSLRARLTLLCLSLSGLTGIIGILAMNVLISIELTKLYSRPPAILNLESATPGADYLDAMRANNDAADLVAHDIRMQSLVGLGVLVLVAGGLCWSVSGRALRPVRRITAVASRLSQDTLHDRIALTGPRDELRSLAESFDAMLERLDRAFDGQRLFVANASHELRTPLTVIRAAADVVLSRPSRPEADYRRALTTIVGAVQRSERLLDSLLRLARTQHRRAGLQRVDLAAAAHAAISPDPSRTAQVRQELAPAVIMGDPNLLELLLRNLVDNAARYNLPDGWVSVRTRTDGQRAVLEVENTGQPIAAEQLPQLLRAFQRGDQARTRPGEGFGLGLAIVDAVVHAHEGDLRIAPRAEGGLLVTVTLAAVPG